MSAHFELYGVSENNNMHFWFHFTICLFTTVKISFRNRYWCVKFYSGVHHLNHTSLHTDPWTELYGG